jgi:general stress protein 26
MSEPNSARETEVKRVLEGAARTIAEVRYCWLATEAEGGGVTARPMVRVSSHPQKTDWAVSFVTDGRSQKASEIRRSRRATLVFQEDGERSYVALIGTAQLCEDRAKVEARWKTAYDMYFPTDIDRGIAAFIEVAVERMDLWIQGVTPEPFGIKTTTLIREASGAWTFAASRKGS